MGNRRSARERLESLPGLSDLARNTIITNANQIKRCYTAVRRNVHPNFVASKEATEWMWFQAAMLLYLEALDYEQYVNWVFRKCLPSIPWPTTVCSRKTIEEFKLELQPSALSSLHREIQYALSCLTQMVRSGRSYRDILQEQTDNVEKRFRLACEMAVGESGFLVAPPDHLDVVVLYLTAKEQAPELVPRLLPYARHAVSWYPYRESVISGLVTQELVDGIPSVLQAGNAAGQELHGGVCGSEHGGDAQGGSDVLAGADGV